MFKRTRLRIFVLIATVSMAVIAIMLSAVFIANRNYSYERSISLLESYAEDNLGVPHPGREPAPEMSPERPKDHNRMFNLSTFYSVLYGNDGNVMKVNSNGGVLYSEQEIIEITETVLAKEKRSGTYGDMPFLVKTDGDKTFVALLDNTMEKDISNRLFRDCLIVGFSAWVIVLILSWICSKKIVDPLELNDIKQKQFISDAGHELKTPISVINTNSDILSKEIGENIWLDNIRYENERMSLLVKDLLDLMRAENAHIAKERLDLSNLVSGEVLPFESIAFEKGLTINTDVEEGIFVLGDRSRFSQLISILTDNAIEHTEGGEAISVRLYSSKNNAIISVVNSGKTIPEETRERLFDRFYRIDDARSDDNGHYGLGLAIAKAIANSHDGTISVNCGDGLVEFKVKIPKN